MGGDQALGDPSTVVARSAASTGANRKMSDNTIFSKKFLPLFLTQFFAAFTDHFIRNVLVFMVLATVASDAAPLYITVAGGVFMLPFVFLSALGGELADRYDKALVARRLKLFEIASAVVAGFGFAYHSIPVMLVSLFMFGIGSALFGPLKYGILPDHLPTDELPKANAWIEGATFIAILAGTVFAGMTFKASTSDVLPVISVLGLFSVLCYAASLMIPSTQPGDTALKIDANIFRSTWRQLVDLKADARLFRASLMVSFFWFAGAVVLSVLPPAVYHLGGDEIAVTAYMALFAVAIAIGSAISAYISGGRVVLLPAAVGTLAVSLFALDFGLVLNGTAPTSAKLGPVEFFSQWNAIRIAMDVAMMAVSGAFLVVPTFTALQTWSKKESRARVIASNNILNAVFMVFGAALIGGLQAAGSTLADTAFTLAGLSLAASVLMFVFLPTSAFRDFLFVLFRVVYRLEVRGAEHLDQAGRSPVIALNHTSFLDAAVALAITDLDPVFAINTEIARKAWVKPFLKVASALPLDPTKPMATRALIRIVEAGRAIGIFPEGRISVTGSLMKVYEGAAMVADKTGSLIVPIHIDGLEKTHFSRLAAHQVKKRLFPKVTVTIVEPTRLSLDPALKGRKRRQAAGAALYGVMSDLVFETSMKKGTIHEEVVRAAERFGRSKIAVEDPEDGSITYGKLLIGARVLGRKFHARFAGEEALGIMLPNSIGAVVTFLGVQSAGLVPSMINFTAGLSGIIEACSASKTRFVLTSRRFVTKGRYDTLVAELSKTVEIVYLEDIRATVTFLDKLEAIIRRASPVIARKQTDRAVVLFTSGSEGPSKGVVHSHAGIMANAAQAAARIDFNSADKTFNILPVFHAFGLTAGTLLPLTNGVPVYMYPSPLHYRMVPEAIYASNATIIFGTDTFLANYARSAHAYDLRSIRYCFAGAEPVRRSTRETYMEKFGIRILEGYGMTEAAPVIALNTPMHNKAGTLGKLMPGMEMRVDPVPGMEPAGILHVRGPNLMLGYLKVTNPGVLEPLVDGWLDTGDVVEVDADSHIVFKERGKMIANIAGEKIAYNTVNQLVGEIWPGVKAVTVAVKDERKGERLVVLTDDPRVNRAEIIAGAKRMGVTERAIPSEIVIAAVPVLGTGKTDFVSARKFVEAYVAA
jgi:acyl-[acyl-carrier-protein]-phospholipid O-acyltransferase/long-chain-fatty-acid--[acyl-carrier-protein] ligase